MEKNVQSAFANRKKIEAEKSKPVVTSEDVKQAWVNKFTPKRLEEWKKVFQGRELIALHVDGKFAVLRPVTADDLGDYVTAISMNGMSKAVAQIMETLWLDGDIELIDNEDLFLSVFLQMNSILEQKKSDFFRF